MSVLMERYRGTVCSCGQAKEVRTLACPTCQMDYSYRQFMEQVKEAPCPACYFHRSGAHIRLTCRNHRDRHYSTKNIHGRSLFYDFRQVEECACSGRDLIHICPMTGKEFAV